MGKIFSVACTDQSIAVCNTFLSNSFVAFVSFCGKSIAKIMVVSSIVYAVNAALSTLYKALLQKICLWSALCDL